MKTDKKLQEDVLAELDFEPSVNAAHVGVTANNGVITLTGEVESFALKMAISRVIERVSGVFGIADEMKINLPSSHVRTDTDIAQAAVEALEWSWLIPRESIKVKVQSGWITLEGEVHWEFQRRQAHTTMNSLTGVRGVSNNLKIKASSQTKIVPHSIETSIKSAFERSAELQSKDISVEVMSGRVTLRGNLPSVQLRDAAVQAAWSASGVTGVENRIVVGA
jgi:osmotically-inducible protein OsmY